MLPCAVQYFPFVPGPGRGLRAGMGGVVPLRIHDRELASGLGPRLSAVTWIGIAVENGLDDRVRRQTLAQQRERLRAVADVDDRLRGRHTDIRFGPEDAVADREDARLHGAADLTRRRIVAKDGEGARAVRIGLLGTRSFSGQEKESAAKRDG